MAKTSGLGDDAYIGGFRIGGDLQDIAVHGGPALLDVTDITQSAHSRLGGLRDAAFDLTAFFDAAAGAAHAALSPLPTADVIVSYLRGQAVGNPTACMQARQVNYDPTRANDGMLTEKINCQADAFGMEWGEQLTAGLRTDTSATTGPFITDAAASSFGGQAYFQVVSVTGTSVTIDIQSATSSGGSYSSTGLTSQAFTSRGAQRVSVANNVTINQFLKVVTTGTFSNAQFFVAFVRNQSAVVF